MSGDKLLIATGFRRAAHAPVWMRVAVVAAEQELLLSVEEALSGLALARHYQLRGEVASTRTTCVLLVLTCLP